MLLFRCASPWCRGVILLFHLEDWKGKACAILWDFHSRFHFLRTSYCSFVTPTNFICTTCSQCGCAAPSASMPPVTSACDVVCSSESMVFPERNSVFVWSESSSRQCFQHSVLSTTCSSECFLVAFSMYNPLQDISKKLQPFETTGSSKPLEAVAPDASQAQ